MKKILTMAGIATLATSAFSDTAFDSEVVKIKGLLGADGPILSDLLDIRKSEWNATGEFANLGYDDGNSDAVEAFADGDTFTEVELMGLAGNIIDGVALNPDGSVIVQFAEGADYLTSSDKTYNPGYSTRLRGHYVKFIPFEVRGDQANKVIVTDSSNNEQIQISDWVCETYDADLSTADYVLFKANKIIETSENTLAQRLVSFAHMLPAPFDKCANTNAY